MNRSPLLFAACLCCFGLFFVAPEPIRGEGDKALQEAKTADDVLAHLDREAQKLNLDELAPRKRAEVLADLLMPASEKLLEVAKTPQEKQTAYEMKLSALTHFTRAQVNWAGVEKAEQKMETFLKELAAKEETKEIEETFHFRYLLLQTQTRGLAKTEQKIDAFLTELAAKQKNERRTQLLKSAVDAIVSLKFETAINNGVPTRQVVRDLSEYIRSPQYKLSEGVKKEMIAALEATARLAPGVDPYLYGKTLDDQNFKWESLRGKYILIKFTATWCGPCKREIPAMQEAYKKYHDKGLEIVSVYMWDRNADPVATIKEAVEEHKIPWIVLAEALAIKGSKFPEYGKFYGITGVPTMVLVDKEGKIIVPRSHSSRDWQTKLAEIFK